MPIKSGPVQSGHWALHTHYAVIHPLDLRPVPPHVRVSLDGPSPLCLCKYKRNMHLFNKSQFI